MPCCALTSFVLFFLAPIPPGPRVLPLAGLLSKIGAGILFLANVWGGSTLMDDDDDAVQRVSFREWTGVATVQPADEALHAR